MAKYSHVDLCEMPFDQKGRELYLVQTTEGEVVYKGDSDEKAQKSVPNEGITFLFRYTLTSQELQDRKSVV